MMMAVAGTRASAPFAFDRKEKPTAPWIYLVVGGSVLAHIAGAVWLYNQRYTMPEGVMPPERVVTLDLYTPPVITPEPTVTEEAPAPPIRVHDPVTIIRSDIETSPIPILDTTTDTAPIGAVVSLDPVPDTTVVGTATEPTLPPVAVITNPQWRRQPSAAQMERAYPRRAAESGLSGRAVLSCAVQADGSVSGCSVSSETPASAGFGDAAMRLSRYFQLSPRTVDGRAVEGARVTIPLNFAIG